MQNLRVVFYQNIRERRNMCGGGIVRCGGMGRLGRPMLRHLFLQFQILVIMSAKAHSEPGPFNTNDFLLKSQLYSQFLIETWANGLIPPSLSLHITDRGIT